MTTTTHPPRRRMRMMFLTVRDMPASCRPCQVVRLPGRALMAVDPRETRLDVMVWMADHLEPWEYDAVTEAYGRVPGEPCPEWMTAPEPVLLYVPQILRLTGEPALQGEAELQRRMATEALEMIGRD